MSVAVGENGDPLQHCHFKACQNEAVRVRKSFVQCLPSLMCILCMCFVFMICLKVSLTCCCSAAILARENFPKKARWWPASAADPAQVVQGKAKQ